MPKSVASSRSYASTTYRDDGDDVGERELEALRNSYLNVQQSRTVPGSPAETRRSGYFQLSDSDLRRTPSSLLPVDENRGLLSAVDGPTSGYRAIPTSVPGTPRFGLQRTLSSANSLRGVRSRHHTRQGSLGLRPVKASGTDPGRTEEEDPESSRSSIYFDDRVWYDQFTSTDWVRDSIADAYRVKELRSRKDWRGRLYAFFDGAQGWILVAIIGCFTAAFAYFIDVIEATIFDYKMGYCTKSWWSSRRRCCSGASGCDDWHSWSEFMPDNSDKKVWADFGAFLGWGVLLSMIACLVTLQTKTTISSAISLSTLDENLAADHHHPKPDKEGRKRSISPTKHFEEATRRPPVVYYPAAGSGVAEVKVILSGFVLHGYLGARTLVCKTVGIIFSVAAGLSLGKEGPYVHIAACIGNVLCRFFPKYGNNDGKRREVLAASAAAGVAVAFGAPIGGVLFSLEEVSYYFPHKTLFRTFFCCIVAALSLKFLDPYGTGKIVLFEVRYLIDWKFFEILVFILVGAMGGALGALFIKASRFWAKTFRRIPAIKKFPMLEVVIVAVATGIMSYWNKFTRLPVAELLYELASPCSAFSDTGSGLCPTEERITHVIWYLCIAFVIKAFLTTVTFGIKVPAGIYVPSMVVGGLLGRIVGHFVQWLTLANPNFANAVGCPASGGSPESCVVPGVYALVAAGATMCGVTRLSVTLAVILFELTGSLEHVLPFSLGVLVAKWTADALEPFSIYDLLTNMNAYPFLDSKVRPVFTTDLGDITPSPSRRRYIDISLSPLVPAKQLRSKLEFLHMAGELDGGLPILKDGILVGLIPAPDLEYALDRVDGEENALCLMNAQDKSHGQTIAPAAMLRNSFSLGLGLEDAVFAEEAQPLQSKQIPGDSTDFTPYIDPAPVSLDIHSPMDVVFECFVKLGLRYICVLKEGKYAGMVHKKAFVRYVKEVES